MDREEILTKAQIEGGGEDLPDREAQRAGAWISYTVGIVLLIAVDIVNGVVLGNFNRGADFALCSMTFVMFLVKYLRLKKRHELFVALAWGAMALAALSVWIMQLAGVM